MPICQAKKGAFTAPNINELQYYCMSIRFKQCPVFKKNRSGRGKSKRETERDEGAIT